LHDHEIGWLFIRLIDRLLLPSSYSSNHVLSEWLTVFVNGHAASIMTWLLFALERALPPPPALAFSVPISSSSLSTADLTPMSRRATTSTANGVELVEAQLLSILHTMCQYEAVVIDMIAQHSLHLLFVLSAAPAMSTSSLRTGLLTLLTSLFTTNPVPVVSTAPLASFSN
jgi:hypothetical protein